MRTFYAVLPVALATLVSAGQKPKHIVFIEFENHSFENMLGWLSRNNSQIRGLTGQEFNYMNASDPSSQKVYVNDQGAYVDPDPGHSLADTAEQVR
jgi:phospholipase C